jgi:hypothetical protein
MVLALLLVRKRLEKIAALHAGQCVLGTTELSQGLLQAIGGRDGLVICPRPRKSQRAPCRTSRQFCFGPEFFTFGAIADVHGKHYGQDVDGYSHHDDRGHCEKMPQTMPVQMKWRRCCTIEVLPVPPRLLRQLPPFRPADFLEIIPHVARGWTSGSTPSFSIPRTAFPELIKRLPFLQPPVPPRPHLAYPVPSGKRSDSG